MSLFRTMPTAGDFSPLFRLLDDYDTHRQSRGQVSSVRSFAPRFDVRETDDAYHFDGELPGIAQKDIDIQFSDPQTLVIKGRSEREYNSPEAGETKEAEGESKAVTKSENKPRSGSASAPLGNSTAPSLSHLALTRRTSRPALRTASSPWSCPRLLLTPARRSPSSK
uniref:Heat shock protein HSP18 n=1 Tax=Aspergillus parasiticus TaxID=5067 RepID=A0A0A8JYI2_ASPPA|nr:heat shock protein HSP18 [Aspergillus parasiticus]BAQ15373.1 heat shock protein HSP18 [Aspergillus parasiticus]